MFNNQFKINALSKSKNIKTYEKKTVLLFKILTYYSFL